MASENDGHEALESGNADSDNELVGEVGMMIA